MVRAARVAEPGSAAAILLAETQEVTMDRSVYQARWLLAPVFGLCFGMVAFGIAFS